MGEPKRLFLECVKELEPDEPSRREYYFWIGAHCGFYHSSKKVSPMSLYNIERKFLLT